MSSFDRPNDATLPALPDDELAPQDASHEGVMLGNSPAMRALYEQMARVARTDAPVLLVGESGTGKELAASTIHSLSRRRDRPFIAGNCGAISPTLIEGELFGHEKGAFNGNGGDRVHRGYFERAHHGTLFLDEIGEMPPDVQLKLLRLLEHGTFVRVGSRTEMRVDVRLISATNRDAARTLRPDLYRRLAVFPLVLPPLRQRGSDVRILATHFLNQLNRAHGTSRTWSPAALERMNAHSWPGNVRELRHYVERAYALGDGMLDAPLEGSPTGPAPVLTASKSVVTVPVGTSLEEACRALILATLERCGGVRKHAAEMLGISLKTLYNKLVAYRVQARAAASAPRTGFEGGDRATSRGD